MAMNVIKMLRICLVEAISACEDNMIMMYNGNEVARREFLERGIDECRRRLRDAGLAHLVLNEEGKPIDQMHKVMSIIGNAPKMLDDLKAEAPLSANRAKLELWTAKWREETAKSKRASDADAPTILSKSVRAAMNSVPGGEAKALSSVEGTERMQRTFNNHLCAFLVVVPNSAITFVKEIGSGSFGSCWQIQIKGVSFFPFSIVYCAKTYKGGDHSKLAQFTTEKNMQKVSPSLVRCIACTGEPPWVSIFPYYNGDTIHRMLMRLPYKMSSYRHMAEKLAKGSINFKPSPDFRPYDYELARIKGFIENMPHIIHAIVNGMNDAHKSNFIHCDLHTRNICLDFTRTGVCRVGIIDWGLMLLGGLSRPSETYSVLNESDEPAMRKIRTEEGEKRRQLRPWSAPELYDPYAVRAYSKASDVYALGYLFSQMIDFWKKGQRHFFSSEFEDHPDFRRIYLLEDQVNRRMFIDSIEERITLLELEDWMREKIQSEPNRAQRPLVEMSPNFL